MAHRTTSLLALAALALGCGDDPAPAPADVAADVSDATVDRAPDVMDRGTCDDPSRPDPETAAPRCTAATSRCIAACYAMGMGALACASACLRADTYPTMVSPTAAGGMITLNCNLCVTVTSLHCMERAGCGAASADYRCCFNSRCQGSTDPMCGPTMCATELQSLITCSPPECLNYLGAEFRLCYARDMAADGGVDGAVSDAAADGR